MNYIKMAYGQDPDEFLYMTDSCWDHLNVSRPPEGLIDWQHENTLLQALSSEYKYVRRAYLERWDFGLADILSLTTCSAGATLQ